MLVAWLLPFGLAHGNGYPSKPIRLVLPFAAGGGIDSAGRALAAGLQAELGQPVVVDNRAGASGTIAANAVRTAEPDGYTLLVATTNILSFPASVLRGKNFDARTDFTPVSQIFEAPLSLAVNAASPITDLRGLISAARKQPGKLTYGSYGVATTSHFCVEELKRRVGVSMVHVPYRGVPTLDLVGGQIDVVCDTVSPIMPFVKAGTVRIIAVTTNERSRFAPDVPTASEQGTSGLVVTTWSAIVAPKGTPAEIVARLNAAIGKVLRSSELQERVGALGYEAKPSTPEELRRFIEAESSRWQALVSEAKISAE
ncbi:MAG: Bug family tripartite tricarboxylate transporter substrate binding protein [Lautropia sp.]